VRKHRSGRWGADDTDPVAGRRVNPAGDVFRIETKSLDAEVEGGQSAHGCAGGARRHGDVVLEAVATPSLTIG
jgi:hypothetical protein